jgi:hypothetical protein
MARGRAETISLRFSRLEKERLLIMLLISLLVHVGAWGGYEIGKKAGVWQKVHWPFQKKVEVKPSAPVVAKNDPPIFLDVAEPSTEAPKNAKYYSANNSVAAQTEETKTATQQPKIDGKQKFVPKTETVPKQVKAPPAQPVTPQKPVEPKPAQPSNPANSLHPGTLDKGNPQDTPDKKNTTEPPDRPRTLREALAQRADQRTGLQMQQEGSVHRRALKSSLDSLSSQFGVYDSALIAAVQQRWYDLLDSQKFALDRTGKVTVTFHLNPDGSVTESKISGNTVGDLLGYVCQEAIEQAAPFGQWPSDMRREYGNFREITFTFYYY